MGVNSLTKGKKHGTLIFMKSITELQMLLDNQDYHNPDYLSVRENE